MIDIELIVNGQNIIPNVYDSAQLQDNLEHSGGLSLSWKSKTDNEIPTGSYVEYQGMRYVLLNPYAPSKEGGPKNTRASYYKYDPTFKHPQALLDKTPLWFKSLDAQGNPIELRTTSYTGFPYVIVKKVVDFMAEYANEMNDDFFAETVGLTKDENDKWQTTWTFNVTAQVDEYGIPTDKSAIITVGFDGASIKGAIDAIADKMGCNVYWDWAHKEILFVAGTTIDGESFNCFHVLGGTTNMGKATVSGGFAAVTQRLTLPASYEWVDEETGERHTEYYPGSIIDMRPNHSGIRLTKELILDNIYPKMELYIKTATARTCYLTDEEGNFIVDHYDVGYDKPVLKTFAKWYVELALDKAGTQPYPFDQSLLIDDKPLSMLFQLDYRDPSSMSKLVGRQFELTYFPEVTKEWDKTDAMVDADGRYTGDTLPYNQGYNAPAGSFRVAFVAEGEIILPTTSAGGLCPQVGDKVTLVNMNLSDEVGRAKTELLAAAREIIALMQTPNGEYSETVIFGDPDQTTHQVPAPRIPRLMVGDATPFGNEHGPIVSAISLNLDTDVAEVTVSSWTRKTRSGGTADKVETVTVSANSSTNGSDNYSNGSIGDGNYGGGSDTQITYSNATPKADSLFLASLNNVVDAVACDASGKVKLDTDVITKITCNYGTKDITSVCNLSYTEDWPYTGTVGDLKAITAFLQNEDASVSTQLTQIDWTYDLSETKRYIRIHFPQGFDMAHFDAKLPFAFVIGHPYFTDRGLVLTVESLMPGVSSYKSTMFVRMDNTPTKPADNKGSYAVPSPTDCLAGQNSDGQNVYWSDGIPAGENKLWATTRIFSNTGVSPQQASWSDPRQMTDTDTYDVEFAKKQANDAKPADPTDANRHGGSGTQIWFDPTLDSSEDFTQMYWRAEREKKNGVWGSWTVVRIKGEKGDSITKTGEIAYYIKNTTGVRPAEDDPNWSTTKPTLGSGEWLFTKIVISWSDESTTILYTDERNPNDGVAGQDIIVDRSEVTYAITQTNQQPDDSAFGPYPSTLVQGCWLWSKATTYYKKAIDNTSAGSSSNYSVSYIAEDGDPGRGITSVNEYYKASANATGETAPSDDSGWSTDPNTAMQNWNQTNKYLWNYEKTTYSSGTTVERSTPSVIAIWTKDGAAGKGIDSIQNYYKITNTLTPPSRSESGWDDDPIAPTAQNPYLWNYEAITWLNPASTSYTAVQMIGHYGHDGSDGISVRAQYSADGSNWHDTFSATDIWMRTSTDNGSTWSTAMKIVGEDGSDGENGSYTDFTFGISEHKTTDNAQTPPSDIYSWSDAPVAVTEQKPYLWSKVVEIDGDGHEISSTTRYIRMTGEDGKSITKQSEEVKYQVGDSGTSAPTGTWYDSRSAASSAYPWTADRFMWTRTIITWSDTSTTTLYSADRNPNDGVSGMDIVAGSTTIQYQLTDTNVQPTSGWGGYPSVLTPGKYLWSKATTPYYKGSVGGASAGESVTYNVSYIAQNGTNGTDGKDGKDGRDGTNGTNGRGIKSITEYYVADNSSSPKSKPSNHVGWTTNPNVPSPYGPWGQDKRYLWNMEETVYTNSDGSETTDYSVPQILAIWTKDGTNGTNGVGIDSIQNYYKVTGSTTPPSKNGSGWQTTPSVPGQGEYLWNYEVITYTNGDTDETDVQMIGSTGVDGSDGHDGQDGQDGHDAVTYEIVFTEAWARKDNADHVTGALAGYAYKIEGSTRTALTSTTIRFGYTGGINATTTTNGYGYFTDSDWFDDDWDDTSVVNYAKSIYASIMINSTAVCTEYINIAFQGAQGQRGATGRMYFMQGKWSASTTYTRTTERIPLVFYSNGNDWNTALECYGHYYYLNANSATGSDVPGVSSKWVLCDEFAIVISRGIFAEFAKLGSFVISGDWMISQTAVSGPHSSDYTHFNPYFPNSQESGTNAKFNGNNFIPVYAVDGRTGKVYMNDAHIRGELKAGNIEVTNSQESGYVWSGIAAHSNQSGYDFFTLGIRDYGDGSYMSRLVLNSNGNTGGWFEASVGGKQTSGILKLGVSKQKTDRVVINSGEVNDPNNSESDQASITVKSSASGSTSKMTPQSVATKNISASGNINLAGQLLATKIQKTTNSSYNASTSDFIIIFNGGSSQTLYLPTTGLSNGQVIIAIKLYDGDVYIYKGSTYLKKAQKDGGSVAICVCDGTTWY